MKSIALVLFAVALLLAQQQDPQDVPEEGKPMSCDNYQQTPSAHRCHCARDRQKCDGIPQPPADVELDKGCSTYCAKQRCLCRGHGCTS